MFLYKVYISTETTVTVEEVDRVIGFDVFPHF